MGMKLWMFGGCYLIGGEINGWCFGGMVRSGNEKGESLCFDLFGFEIVLVFWDWKNGCGRDKKGMGRRIRV